MKLNKTTDDMTDIVITDGIDIAEWNVNTKLKDGRDTTVTYAMWDFAGQSVYYNTHQVIDCTTFLNIITLV
jgi:hypothetical protein